MESVKILKIGCRVDYLSGSGKGTGYVKRIWPLQNMATVLFFPGRREIPAAAHEMKHSEKCKCKEVIK